MKYDHIITKDSNTLLSLFSSNTNESVPPPKLIKLSEPDPLSYDVKKMQTISISSLNSILSNVNTISIDDGLSLVINHLKRYIPPQHPYFDVFVSNTKEFYRFLKESENPETKKPLTIACEEYVHYSNITNGSIDSIISPKTKTRDYEVELFTYHQVNGVKCQTTPDYVKFSNLKCGEKNFNIQMASCGASFYTSEGYLFFIGTRYGAVYIYMNDQLIAALFLENSITKIRTFEGFRFAILTNYEAKIYEINKTSIILMKCLKAKIIDVDMYGNNLATIIHTKNENFYLKIEDTAKIWFNQEAIKKLKQSKTDTKNSREYIDLSDIPSDYRQGYCFKIPKSLYDSDDHRDFYSKNIIPIDILFFKGSDTIQYKKIESSYTMNIALGKITIFDYSGNIFTYTINTSNE